MSIRPTAELDRTITRAVALAVERDDASTTCEHLLFALADDADARIVLVEGLAEDGVLDLKETLLGWLDSNMPKASAVTSFGPIAKGSLEPQARLSLSAAATVAGNNRLPAFNGLHLLAEIADDDVNSSFAMELLRSHGFDACEIGLRAYEGEDGADKDGADKSGADKDGGPQGPTLLHWSKTNPPIRPNTTDLGDPLLRIGFLGMDRSGSMGGGSSHNEMMQRLLNDSLRSLGRGFGAGIDGTGRKGMFEDVSVRKSGKEGEGEAAVPQALRSFLLDLTAQAAAGKLDPTVGRTIEINRVVGVLARRRKNNAILVGEPGVGKTAVAEGLASRIASGDIPERLKGHKVFSLDLPAMVAGTRYRGDFEERVKGCVAFLEASPNAILFVDEVHTLVGGGGSEGGMDASNLLKPALARGQLRCVGATTHAEYKRIEKDKALARRFERIDVSEPSVEESVLILRGLRAKYEQHHGVSIDDKALSACAELSAKHLRDRRLPDKAIDLMDEAMARASLSGSKEPVGKGDIEDAVSRIARIPESSVRGSAGALNVLALASRLNAKVFGQEAAVEAVVKAVKIDRAGLKREDRPVGCFLFAGPTGVGKTELTKRLAEELGAPLLRFDMSEYMEKHAVSRLIGSPPGYVGHEEGGQVTDAVAKSPDAVILLDEIEKAHPDIAQILLQILDGGRLTDSVGKTVDFRRTFVVLTTNLGAQEKAESKASIGFLSAPAEKAGAEDKEILGAVDRALAPELRNRFDRILCFERLSRSCMGSIAKKALEELAEQTGRRGIALSWTEAALDLLAKRGYDPAMGARPLARLTDAEIREPLADLILAEGLGDGGTVFIGADGEGWTFSAEKAAEAA